MKNTLPSEKEKTNIDIAGLLILLAVFTATMTSMTV